RTCSGDNFRAWPCRRCLPGRYRPVRQVADLQSRVPSADVRKGLAPPAPQGVSILARGQLLWERRDAAFGGDLAMTLEQIDLTDLDFFMNGNVIGAFQLLRAEDPVHWQEKRPGRGFWSL